MVDSWYDGKDVLVERSVLVPEMMDIVIYMYCFIFLDKIVSLMYGNYEKEGGKAPYKRGNKRILQLSQV